MRKGRRVKEKKTGVNLYELLRICVTLNFLVRVGLFSCSFSSISRRVVSSSFFAHFSSFFLFLSKLKLCGFSPVCVLSKIEQKEKEESYRRWKQKTARKCTSWGSFKSSLCVLFLIIFVMNRRSVCDRWCVMWIFISILRKNDGN